MSKILKSIAFQGDICLRIVDSIPDSFKPTAPENGRYIVAHSETGHHHVVKERGAQLLIDETNAFISYLDVKEPNKIKHLRPYNTHEAIALAPGKIEIRRQREYTPEGLRRAED